MKFVEVKEREDSVITYFLFKSHLSSGGEIRRLFDLMYIFVQSERIVQFPRTQIYNLKERNIFVYLTGF